MDKLDKTSAGPGTAWLCPQTASLTAPGPLLQTFAVHTDRVTALAVLPDGRAVSGSPDWIVIVWDLARGAFVGVAAMMLVVAGFLQWRVRLAPCPADPLLASACLRLRRMSASIYAASIAIFVVGVLFAFVLPAFLG